MTSFYVPIFLDSDWANQKYYGWRLKQHSNAVLVLQKRYGPARRFLVLSTNAGLDNVGKLLDEVGAGGPFDEVFFQDFSDSGADFREISGRRFDRVEDRQRLLNKATFVVNLQSELETLWGRMSSDYRRACRNATESGVTVEFLQSFDASLMEIFFSRYTALAKKNELDPLDERLVQKMFRNKNLFLAVTKEGDLVHGLLLVYYTKSTGYFFHSVGSESKNDRSGRLLHWEVIKYLKTMGFLWYDLGGLPDVSDANGIYRFKKGFGGELVLLGTQYVYRSWLVRVLHICNRWLKAVKHSLGKL